MENSAQAFTYQFSALRGRQAGHEYYAAMVPLALVPKMFLFDDDELKPELRAQRKLNRARVPEIARYVLDHPSEYVFSALTASIDGDIHFQAIGGAEPASGVGVLAVSMSARFVINDGQHRRAAIEQVIREQPELGNETICVVLFRDAGLERSQQMFADLNRHAVRPTRSIGVLYDHRDPLSNLARQLVSEVAIFRDLTELDKATISNRSIKLFTLSSIYFATRQLLGKAARAPVSVADSRLAARFWTEVSKHMRDWQLAARREISSAELRKDFIHAHGVGLQALAIAGQSLIERFPDAWAPKLKGLQSIDWSRNNRRLWEGRALIGGRVSKATNNVGLTANAIKKHLGLRLSAKELTLETSHDAASRRGPKGRNTSPRPANNNGRVPSGARKADAGHVPRRLAAVGDRL